MVTIHLPPPQRPISPVSWPLPAGSPLVRIFDPTDHNQTATGFRFAGPFKRFDHHRRLGQRWDDPERGIFYTAPSLEACLVEVFGDNNDGSIEPEERHVAFITTARELHLLDLRGTGRNNGAWKAGSVEALSKNGEYAPSQAWSRYFYENPDRYSLVDGLIYSNAHNGDDAIALYERANDAITCPVDQVLRLDDADLRPLLIEAALSTGLTPPTS